MLFDLPHILYMVVSGVVTAILLVLCALFIKKQEHKNLILKVSAIVTVILHYSNIWVEYFTNGGSTAGLSGIHLLAIYPCHIMMWMLLIASFTKNKQGKLFTVLGEFCFWGGVICGSIGIILNDNYASTPNLANWNILKGLLSHSTMLFGCIYMLVGKFIKIRVFNVVSVTIGLTVFIIDGMFVNLIYDLCNLPEVNAMYLLHSPYPSMPWLSPILMGVVGLAILFAGLALYELRLPKEERWYVKVKHYTDELKSKIKGN